jgi:hypothetical protein
MKKTNKQGTSIFNYTRMLTIISIFAAIITSVFYMEDRFNQKSECNTIYNKVVNVEKSNEALKIKFLLKVNQENLKSAVSRLNMLKTNKNDPALYKIISKDEVINDLNTLPNIIKEIEQRIDALIKKEMEYAQYF